MGNYLTGLLLDDVPGTAAVPSSWDDYQTGDVVLFHESFPHVIAQGVEAATHSPYGHTAMVLRDFDEEHPGLYLLQSDGRSVPDAQDHTLKFGVQISPFRAYLEHEGYLPAASEGQHAEVRRLKGVKRDAEFYANLQRALGVVHDKPYDLNPVDWIVAEGRQLGIAPPAVRQRTDTFWCSALVGFMLVQLKVMPEKTDWTYLAPSDFGGADVEFLEAPTRVVDSCSEIQ